MQVPWLARAHVNCYGWSTPGSCRSAGPVFRTKGWGLAGARKCLLLIHNGHDVIIHDHPHQIYSVIRNNWHVWQTKSSTQGCRVAPYGFLWDVHCQHASTAVAMAWLQLPPSPASGLWPRLHFARLRRWLRGQPACLQLLGTVLCVSITWAHEKNSYVTDPQLT